MHARIATELEVIVCTYRQIQHQHIAMADKKLKSVSIKRGKDSPVTMCRGAAAAGDGKCYFMTLDDVHSDTNIHVYDSVKDDWFAARQGLYKNASLAVIDGQITTIGGDVSFGKCSNALHTLSNRRWTEKYPPMIVDPALDINNSKSCMSVVQSGNLVIVIGGTNSSTGSQKRVDILNTETSVWTDVHDVPYSVSRGSATIAGDELYVECNGHVYQCFLDELQDDSKPAGSVWTTVPPTPSGSHHPTLGSLCGQAVSFGGNDSRTISAYDPDKQSWYDIGKMAIGRTRPLVAQLTPDTVVVAGGSSGKCGCGNDVVVTEIITGVLQ